MKRVTAIVRPEKMEPLKDALFAADVKGMTISQVHGCGAQHGWSEYVRGTEVMPVSYTHLSRTCTSAFPRSLTRCPPRTSRWMTP